ncbi:FecR domain-containing protein [Butyricimonas sp.]|uniref:FecR family protein n=1 Tax=Butyricimonas sp. TaxID=1969738 RepID=UPI0025BB87B2|nr:FecR domain-containing protein [Butyricimonas sp.]
MAKNNKEIRDIYFEYYRTKRSREFMDQHDSWKSWLELKGKIKRYRIRRIRRIASVAAAIAVFVTFTVYFHIVYVFKVNEPVMLATSFSFPEMKSKKATLVFDDGVKVDLTERTGRLDNEGNMAEINNVDRRLVYKQTEAVPVEVKYNTLSVPRGGEYQLVLSDGTKVWVNAESSLRYPETFGEKRELVLTGEAYFEVAKDSTRPFIVHVGDNAIEVLGTHFNVASYEKGEVYTTLAEGRVKVSHNGQSVILNPDEQAIIESGTSGIGVREVDASLYTSWINGRYEFRDTELESIAAQLSRWYDVDIRFAAEGLKHKRFAGVIYRDEELGFTIKVIERVANVRFTREDNTIYIDNPK